MAALILVGAMLAACGNAGTSETATTVAEAPTTTTTVAETTTTVIETTSPANAKMLPITSLHRLEEHVTQPNRFLRPVMHGQGDGAMLSQLIVEIPAWEPENLCANPDGEFCHDFSEQIPNG